MKTTCALLILGAGPAGCALAIQAQRAGFQTVVLERAARPRRSPGETLHPGVEPILRQLGVWEPLMAQGCHRHRGIWLSWDGTRSFVPYGCDEDGSPWLGLQVNRQALQGLLWEAVSREGVLLRLGQQAPELLWSQEQELVGARVGEQCFEAPWIVDATGRHQYLARRLPPSLSQRYLYGPPLYSRFGWERVGHADDQPSLTRTRDGWEWIAPIDQREVAWVRLSFGPEDDSPGATQRPSGMDVSWRLNFPCAGPGWFLLGDAAAQLDPGASHGVLRGLMSGMMVAHLLQAMEKRALTQEQALSYYNGWLHAWFRSDLERLSELYGVLPNQRLQPLPKLPSQPN